MAKREVKHVTQVNYRAMTDEQLREVYHLNELKTEWQATFFDVEDDDYVCYRDMDDDTENHDERAYAVYLKSTGELLCLVADAGMALEGWLDHDYCSKRNELYKQIALLAGWPENMSDLQVGMTWRQLIKKLNDELPKEFLDTPAYVWRPDYGGSIAAVKGIMPWCEYYHGDGVPGPGAPDYNVFFINNSLDGEE